MNKEKMRCTWVGNGKPIYEHYHDVEWGVPVHDDRLHFEMLILEGAQAGLGWEIILNRREGYCKAFKNFAVEKVAAMTDEELGKLMLDSGIIRNRLKIFGARKNALAFLALQKEFGSFDAYVWSFVGGKTLQNSRKTLQDYVSRSPESEALSKDLKKRGMTFVGPTIIHAYMQAIGIVNDHLITCFRYKELG